jgi:hypothetical protein
MLRTIGTLLTPVHCFFVADGTQSNDRLVEVVRHDPVSGVRRIKSIALFSVVWNLAAGGACASFLWASWSRCDDCDQLLKWWLLAQAALQFSQLPVRAVLFLSVCCLEPTDGRVEDSIKSVTAAPAWHLSKKVAFLQYGWFALGILWLLRSASCPSCPGLGRLTAVLILLSLARAAVALAAFRDKFAGAFRALLLEPAVAAGAATACQIAALPIEEVRLLSSSEASRGSDSGCSICLGDFEVGSRLKRLPCQHAFHCSCVDQWLQRSKRCPLCMRAIDESPNT